MGCCVGEVGKCEIPQSFDMEDLGTDVKIPGSNGAVKTFRLGDQYIRLNMQVYSHHLNLAILHHPTPVSKGTNTNGNPKEQNLTEHKVHFGDSGMCYYSWEET